MILFQLAGDSAHLALLMAGVGNTLLLSLTTIIGGGIGGVAVCLMRLYAPRPMNWLAIAFIDLFRAIPILVLLILVYYALPFMGIRLDSFSSAALALGLVFSAFTAEVVRAGILAIPAGQLEAAKSIGLPFWVTMQRVVLPQALRVSLPPHTSNCVAIAKDTSLASVVAMPDLLKQATDAQALVANPVTADSRSLALSVFFASRRAAGSVAGRKIQTGAKMTSPFAEPWRMKPERSNNLFGIALMVGGMVGLSLGDLFLKLSARSLPVGEVMLVMGLGSAADLSRPGAGLCPQVWHRS